MNITLVEMVMQFSFLLNTIKIAVVHGSRLSISQRNRASPLGGAHQVIIILLHLQLPPQLTAQPVAKDSLSCKRQTY